MMTPIMLFFVGALEMVIVTAWTKVVTKSQVLMSGLVTIINILIWYYVLRILIEDIQNWYLVILYALGCAVGTAGSTYLFQLEEKRKRRTRRAKKAAFVETAQADLIINE